MKQEEKDIERLGKAGKGRRHMLRHLKGEVLTRKESMEAMCYYCQGYNADGQRDCGCTDCPLYPWMPYQYLKSG